MNFRNITEEFAKMERRSTMAGGHTDVSYFRNSSKYEVRKVEKELEDEGVYEGLRVILIPFTIEDGQKVCDMENETPFKDIDMYIWDARVYHETALEDIKTLGYKKKDGGGLINMMHVFAGVKTIGNDFFEIGPFAKSYFVDESDVDRRDILAVKACKMASEKTGNDVRIDYF